MNGAITLPCAKNRSPPMRAIMVMTGQSQNFLRARMKAKSSRSTATPASFLPSELPGQGIRRRPRRLPVDPVRGRVRLAPETQGILAAAATEPGERGDHEKEEDSQEQ